MHEMRLQERYFDLIASGKKTYEVRLNDEKRQRIRIGDLIVFRNEANLDRLQVKRVEKLSFFSSFEEMLSVLDKKDIGFFSENNDEVISIYHQFYSVEDENKYGVLAIKLKDINNKLN